MATIKAVTRPYKNQNGEQKVYIRISHKGDSKYISTNITLEPKYWSAKDGEVKTTLSGWVKMNETINRIKEVYKNRLTQLIQNYSEFTLDQILDIPKSENFKDDFFPFAENYIQKFKRNPRNTSFKRHNTVLNKLREFVGEGLKFSEIDVTFLTKFENFLSDRGNKINTIYSNLKIVRAIYYQAIRQGIASQEKNPFFIYKLKSEKVYKEKLHEYQVLELARAENFQLSSLNHAKNLFLASYYMAGMRFGDICILKVKNISRGRINYVMSKTNKKMSLPINDELKSIFEFYGVREKNPDDFIFPILNPCKNYADSEVFSNEMDAKNTIISKNLKKIAAHFSWSINLTFHIARHSFADISRKKGVSIYDISKLLGHSSIKVTENYLASIDPETYDSALEIVYG